MTEDVENNSCLYSTRNLIKNNSIHINTGLVYYNDTSVSFRSSILPGKYAVSIKINSDVDYTLHASYFRACTSGNYSASTRVVNQSIGADTRYFTFEVEQEIKSIFIFARDTVSQCGTQTLQVEYIQLEKVDSLEEPQHNLISSFTNQDVVARERIYLEPSSSSELNRINIEGMLNYYGYCNLGPGTFYVDKAINMPNYTKLSGSGSSTKLILDTNRSESVVGLSPRCTIENLTLLGSESDIELDGNFMANYVEETSSVNLWTNAVNQTVESFSHIVLDTPLPPGTYAVLADVSKSGSSPYLAFSRNNDGYISPADIIGTVPFTQQSGRQIHYTTIFETAYSVRLSSAATTSSGITSTWSNIRIYPVGGRMGIFFMNRIEDFCTCIINNVTFAHFNCAGIWAINTGTPLDRNMIISNCVFYNNNVGIFLVKDTEFNRISNCSIYKNYIGYYNRGGNNNIDNCGIDGNVIGILVDDLSGSNGGHGTICNCSINHSDSNTGYGLIVSGTGRMLMSNCNLYYSKIKLENTSGNVISNCGFGRSSGWEVTGGTCSTFINCMVIGTGSDNTPITVTNNTDVKVVNCYTRSGALVPQPV